ncbi:MAG TPA: MFS transporter, partial [Ktedonobacteraceae bacterium]|nr:MFS transporter [Ktedonobacteraceae bacterium]
MPSLSNTSETSTRTHSLEQGPKRRQLLIFELPKNVYLLLFFTLGKGFQLTIATLTLNYYAYSLGYHPDFIGLFSAMPAIGALIGAVPIGLLADRQGRKPVLLISAILTPAFLALTALMTSAPLLLACSLIQGTVATAYWVTNLPLLVESTTERQRIGVLALNSFLLLGVGALGNLLGGAIPEFVAGMLHVSAASMLPLRWGVISAALFTFIFGLPLWFLSESKRSKAGDTAAVTIEGAEGTPQTASKEKPSIILFGQLLLPDLVFTMGEGAVVALIQLYFVLRFHLLPGP